MFEMPNTNPPTVNAKRLKDKLNLAKGRMWCDHAFYAGASPENVKELAELEKMPGICGVKMFIGASTGSLLVPDDETILTGIKKRVHELMLAKHQATGASGEAKVAAPI